MGEDGVVYILHVRTNDMVADVLTKPLSAEPFERHGGKITGTNNCNANCAEGFWLSKQDKNITAVMRRREIFRLVR